MTGSGSGAPWLPTPAAPVSSSPSAAATPSATCGSGWRPRPRPATSRTTRRRSRSRCRPSTPWSSPTRTAPPSWPRASRCSPRSGRPWTSWPTGTPAATAWAGTQHDSRLFVGFERFFRPAFRNLLSPEWLPSVPGLVERLRAGVRVLDVGCGLGTATIAMAEAFPASTFMGIDYHEESVRRARQRGGAKPECRPGRVPGARRRVVRGGRTTSSACSTPCTTSATRSARWRSRRRT